VCRTSRCVIASQKGKGRVRRARQPRSKKVTGPLSQTTSSRGKEKNHTEPSGPPPPEKKKGGKRIWVRLRRRKRRSRDRRKRTDLLSASVSTRGKADHAHVPEAEEKPAVAVPTPRRSIRATGEKKGRRPLRRVSGRSPRKGVPDLVAEDKRQRRLHQLKLFRRERKKRKTTRLELCDRQLRG